MLTTGFERSDRAQVRFLIEGGREKEKIQRVLIQIIQNESKIAFKKITVFSFSFSFDLG